MTIHKMRTTNFEDRNYLEWKEVAVKSLRGKPFEELITKTPEGIDLQPLYIGDQLDNISAIATIREAKQQTGWIVAQQQYALDAKSFIAELTNSIERGNEAIIYDGANPFEWDEKSLEKLAKLIASYPIFITNTSENDQLLKAFDIVAQEDRSKVRGAVSISGWRLPEDYPNVRTICADVRSAHLNGADAVTELALAIAEGAENAITYQSFRELSDQFFVRFAIDTHFFMEIAKIRAFRILWNALGKSFGEKTVTHIPILTETSLRTYSKLDPYVNLLRAGNEAFSAVLGGADVITVHPHDVLTGTTPASIRYARNVQLVIKNETLVDKVLDPSGGSYFIDTLTNELVEKAWALFVEIDAAGGYNAYVKSGKLGQRLKACRSASAEEVAKGKKSLIGTNIYADLSAIELKETYGIEVEGRLAEPFEKIRAHFQELQPKTILLTFGELKDVKPRADFVSGLLATGGVHSEWSPLFTSAQEANEWLAHEKPDYVVVCGNPSVTEEVMTDLLQDFPNGILIDAAGKYETEVSEHWLANGLNGFIFSGQDKIAKLTEIKNKWKGDANNEKA
ncbi:methylmalonyl-CoA mutase [Sporosarcina sp. Marseille-Q4063]|uniref:methylmalonyl-CoA mutase family protein n=1 Tax=Sporosarcina sp. Marseille-Q4063 TaxID=2810514 RepID=UPI001BAEA2DD|nr:methylmalonyl-CoA mutase family protein [Sporosarcina sp. Marseille-Q4063]QUW22301.1 methylmalonyl-CoA mutase [Sporosarcina sp. Marseille-Q4063]